MKKTRKTLAALLIITTILFAAAGAYLKYAVFAKLDLFQDDFIVTVPFLFLADESAQYALESSMNQQPTEAPQLTEPVTVQTEPEPVTVPTEPEPEKEQETIPVQESESATIPEETIPTEPELIQIDESWFDDALFIGDSRTVGLRDIARLGEADYFCDLSMTVFRVMNCSVYDRGFGKDRLAGALDKNQYGKVFIHLGLNECPNPPELVISKYQELIDLIKEKQPDAKIIIQSIMTVSEWKAKDPKFSLERITNLNAQLELLAEDNGLIYLDTNEWAADEEGFLREEIRMDGSHPTGIGYQEWAQWLMDKAGYFGIP